MVLLGKHAFLLALPQKAVLRRLREQIHKRTAAEMSRARKMSSRGESQRQWGVDPIGMRSVPQLQREQQKILISWTHYF